ncbi:MAG TPA: creatininase family protein [Acidobacteriaceae bacterium]|nr:creatininase family protein [Acidobacteriaceae bacterium]
MLRIRSCVGMIAAALVIAANAGAQEKLSTHWEELTGPDFVRAIHQAGGVCLLPFGILEKHGPHLPIGTDLINARWVAEHAAAQEYAVIFPAYYFGQIDEARHQPGTIAYSRHMQLDLLQETTDEMARNGCKKILIVNGHGGNLSLLPYFAQTELQMPHDYVVYVYWWDNRNGQGRPKQQTTNDMHAGESETSHTLITRPDLVHMDRANQQSGADQARLHLPADVYTGIWWYARFPNHYSGDGSKATKELGEYDMKAWTDDLVTAIRAVKADDESQKLQNEFFEEAQHPLDTKQ